MFNTKEKTPVYFDKASLRKTKDGVKVARLRIAIPLVAEIAMHCSPEIQAAFEACETLENKITYVELDNIMAGVNVEFYQLPDSKAISLALPSAELHRFVVERHESRETAGTRLLFSIEIFIEENVNLRHWIVDNVFNQMWAKFEIQQMSLMPNLGAAKDHCPYPGCKLEPKHGGDHGGGSKVM